MLIRSAPSKQSANYQNFSHHRFDWYMLADTRIDYFSISMFHKRNLLDTLAPEETKKARSHNRGCPGKTQSFSLRGDSRKFCLTRISNLTDYSSNEMRTSISTTSGHVHIFVKPAASDRHIKHGKRNYPINLPASRSNSVPANGIASKKMRRLTALLKLILRDQFALRGNFFSIKHSVQSGTAIE